MKKTGAGGEIYDQPLRESYKIDVVKEITSLLSEELAKSIIKKLFNKK